MKEKVININLDNILIAAAVVVVGGNIGKYVAQTVYSPSERVQEEAQVNKAFDVLYGDNRLSFLDDGTPVYNLKDQDGSRAIVFDTNRNGVFDGGDIARVTLSDSGKASTYSGKDTFFKPSLDPMMKHVRDKFDHYTAQKPQKNHQTQRR